MTTKTISLKAKKVLATHLLFTTATTLTGSFSFIFLWRLKNDFLFLASYELMYVSLTLAGYIFAGYLLTKISSKTILRLSFIASIAGYMIILFLKEETINYVVPLGIVVGIGNGLYWGIYNLMQLRETTDNNREFYLGTLSGLFTLLSTFGPAITGFIIITVPVLTKIDFSGYYLIYALSSALMLVLIGYTESLPEIDLTYFRFKQIISTTNSQKFRALSLYELFNGIFETGTQMVFIILSFMLLSNELNIGLLSSMFGFLSALYIYFVGKKLNIKKRFLFVLIGCLLIVLGRFVFVYFFSLESLIFERLLSVIGGPLFGLPATALILSSIEDRSQFIVEKEQEFLVAREIPLGFGRFFGMLFFLIFIYIFGSNNMSMIRTWFLLISIIPLIQFFLLKKVRIIK